MNKSSLLSSSEKDRDTDTDTNTNSKSYDLKHEIFAATAAGIVCTLIGHPLDTIKVHLQVPSRPSSPVTTKNVSSKNAVSPLQTARSLWHQRALFRGIGPPMFNAILMNTVMFGAFGAVKDVTADSSTCDSSDDVVSCPSTNTTIGNSILAGTVAGVITACISTPTDYIKIQSQLYGGSNSSSFNSLKDIIHTRQPNVLYRGHIPNVIREGIFTAVYLGLYDIIMSRWCPPVSFDHNSIENTTSNHLNEEGERPLWKVVTISSITGAMAWVASYPADTIKSVMQARGIHQRSYTMKEACRIIPCQRGESSSSSMLNAFYRGCATSTTRAALVTSLRMFTYEAVMSWITR